MSQEPDPRRTDTSSMPAGGRAAADPSPSTSAMPAAGRDAGSESGRDTGYDTGRDTSYDTGRDTGFAASGETRYDPARPTQPPVAYPQRTEDYQPGDQPDDGPTYARRIDGVASVLLLLAGAATAGSMLLPWVVGQPETGFDLVLDQRWEPWAVLIGGGVALLMGLLALAPLRSRRLVGLLALLGGVAIAAAVLRPLYLADWDTSLVDYGLALAAEAGGLALLGGLKALLTPRRKQPDVSA